MINHGKIRYFEKLKNKSYYVPQGPLRETLRVRLFYFVPQVIQWKTISVHLSSARDTEGNFVRFRILLLKTLNTINHVQT